MENNTSMLSNVSLNFLWRYIRDLNLKNCTLDITPATVCGDNHLGVVAKVEVKSDTSNYNWIIKCAIEDEVFRSNLPLTLAFEREVYVYTKVLVEFNRFQEEKTISSPFKSFPKLYTFSLSPPHECVVMENMKELGYTLQDRKQPLNYNHVLMVMREYGRFHALSFALRDQRPSLFKDIAENTEELYFNSFGCREEIVNFMKKRADSALNALNPIVHKHIYNKLTDFKENMLKTAQTVTKSKMSGAYSVVTHGDCWINNFLFKYLNPSEPDFPSEMCFIDFQLSCLGSPVLDLSYFLFSSTDQQFRIKYYDEMIREYHDSLSSFLRKLGSDPEKLFPFSVLKEHLKVFSVFGLYMTIQVLPSMLSDHEEMPDFLNGPDEKVNKVSTDIEPYNNRVREVLLDYDKLGYNLNTVSN